MIYALTCVSFNVLEGERQVFLSTYLKKCSSGRKSQAFATILCVNNMEKCIILNGMGSKMSSIHCPDLHPALIGLFTDIANVCNYD